jgi:hypothetical protein
MAQGERGTGRPRALFDNFSTAFESITKSNSGIKVSAYASSSTDTLLPTTTFQVSTTSPQYRDNDGTSTAESSQTHHTGRDNNTPTQESPLRRIARKFPNIRGFKRKDTLVDETQVTRDSSPPVATDPSRIGSEAVGRLTRELERAHTLTLLECNIQPTAPDKWWEELPQLGLAIPEDGQGDPSKDVSHLSHRASNPSNAAVESPHRLKSDSYYADSTTGGYRPPSTVVGNHQTIAFGHKTGLLDYADETIDLSSHPYEFAETSHNDPQLVASNHQTDTLLSGTIRGYQSEQETSPSTPAVLQSEGDLSQQPLVTEGRMEDDILANTSACGRKDGERREEFTSGLSQFDFGLDQNSSLGEASLATRPGWKLPESIPAPLQIAPGPPPTAPLPPAPDSRFVESSYMQNFPTQCQSDVGSSRISYGDTRNLLNPEENEYLSTPSLDAMHGVIEDSVNDATTQAIALLSSQSELPYNLKTADTSTHTAQHEAFDLERVHGEPFSSELNMPEIEHALTTVNVNQENDVSDVTELSTDIYHDGAYYIDDHSLQVAPLNVTPKGVASNGGSSRIPDVWHDQLRTDTTIENDDPKVSPVEQPHRGTYQNDSTTKVKLSRPSAIHSSTFPGIWHIPDPLQGDPMPIRSRARSKTKKAPMKASTDTHLDADDQDEWETVLDDSRQNLVDASSNSIMGDISRFPRNVRDFSATIHPANSTFNVSRYRLRSPAGSGEPFMVPEYQYGPSSAFTHRNALMPPVSAVVTGNSSSPTSTSQRPKAQRMTHQIDVLHHAVSTESPSPSARRQQDSPYVDPKLLSPDPNDDIVYEGVPSLLSQPASPHGNSFNKFTGFGPNANLTGSFLGTGMRNAGSSLADSSSPVHPDSSSQAQHKPSPLAQVVGPKEPSTPTGTVSLTPQSGRLRLKTLSQEMSEINFLEEYNIKAQEMQTAQSRHTTVLKHKPRFLPIAPPKAHIRTSLSRDEYFDLQRASRSDNVPHSALIKPSQGTVSGVRPPPQSHTQLQVSNQNPIPYNPFRKPPVPAIPNYEEEDLIELDSLPSRSSFSRPFHLASRANTTLSKDTLRTQSTGYSMLVPSRYESSAHTITPFRTKRTGSQTSGSGHHRRQFSGSALAQLRLSHSEVVLRRHKQAMDEFTERIRKKEVFWSNFILWTLCWTSAVPLVVWGTNKLDPLMVWLTGINGATFTEQSKRKSLIVGVFFGIFYCTVVAILVPLGVTGVVKWS